ncbi:rod shape-determining protein MreC [Candidatus Daviesbacteria bacterium]|nr:rod shape-determining protein MreC [Candidatus Daviesbacteria bacterium]
MDQVFPNLKLFIILIILTLIILATDLLNLLSLPKSMLSFVTNPISLGLFQTEKNVGRQLYFLVALRSASQENKALKGQIGQLLSENARLRENLAEAQSQVTQQQYLSTANYNLLPARPVGINRYLKIDQGSTAGVKVGQAVVYNDNFIGKIVQVGERSANIQLLTDPDSKVAAFSQSLSGKAKGVLLGQFGADILLDKILHEEKIEEGDLVYSEGTEGFLPRGLILGRVVKVLEQRSQVFKQAKIAANFDIRDLELVYVIKEE